MTDILLSERIKNRLRKIYNSVPFTNRQFKELLNEIYNTRQKINTGKEKWSEESIVLITYGDSIVKRGEKPLKTLNGFLQKFLTGSVSHVHILPFFPYSSDDGFSVIDYRKVNAALGSWKDIREIGRNYNLMFDLVINHISQQSVWFKNYCNQKEPWKSYFIETDPGTDLSKVVRPRSLPLLSEFDTVKGLKYVWTTFSADQIDLNFSNPMVLLEMLKILLFYLQKGARVIRLDAIAFLWKEIGTSCLHLPQNHEIVKLMRDITGFISEDIILITETNVPNKENLSYFGDGDEADMVYQFSLPPLLLHSLYTANSTYLNRWVSSLADIPHGCTFFNFTASHDGIGVRPLEGLLSQNEINTLVKAIEEQGGYVSTKRNSDNSDSPYELNISYLDALKKTCEGEDNLQIERFLCSQTLMMSFRGIPAFYIHSLLGTHNDYQGVARTGMFRSINRYKWDAGDLYDKLSKGTSHSFILSELLRRISIRKKEPTFHPDSPQEVIVSDADIFMISRGNRKDFIVLANLSPRKKTIDPKNFIAPIQGSVDLLNDRTIGEEPFILNPYQVCWIKKSLF